MANDGRDTVELLKDELDFIEKGGYGRSVHTPWRPKSAFQDSLTCLNYGYPNPACNECHLIDFVGPEHQGEEIPCHFIPLNEAGETVEALEREDNDAKIERKVRDWLLHTIREIEEGRASHNRRVTLHKRSRKMPGESMRRNESTLAGLMEGGR